MLTLQLLKRVLEGSASLWHKLTEPSSMIQDLTQRRNVRLLSTFLLCLFALFLAVNLGYTVSVPGYKVPPADLAGYLILAGTYLVSRSRWARVATAIMLAMFPLNVMGNIVAGTTFDPTVTLLFLVPGFILASIFLSVLGITIYGLAILLAIVTLPMLSPSVVGSLSMLVGPLSLNLISMVLLAIAIIHRDGIERDRTAELQREIAARKQVEVEREGLITELQVRNVELENKNAELERFIYTVSHELKTPLVTIRGFLGFLEEDALAGRFDRMQADMARIVQATDKMERQLTEVLELSRIGRRMNPPETVPIEAIICEAVELVRGRLDVRGVQVDMAPNLPTVYGERARLVEVVQNLVDNACKFMGAQPNPRIEIGAQADADGQPVFFVRDNGIGIEPKYHERVFGLFDKLDAQSEGTGVGLALVRRIVEVHGGRIWVESEGMGHGATFLFTLASK